MVQIDFLKKLQYYRLTDNIEVLQAYGNAYDGLSYVSYRLTSNLRNKVDLNSDNSKMKRLIPAMPHIYGPYLDQEHVNVSFTTIETTCLPKQWVFDLNKYYQACIVPHLNIKKIFIQSGVKIPIFTVHQGYTRLPQLNKQQYNTLPFVIGFLGVPQARKNVFKLFKACQALIQSGEIPKLKLSIHVATYYDELDTAWFKPLKDSGFVIYSEGTKTEKELSEWYSSLSAYCFPSSGEGWSFTPRESLYLGIPTIISTITVHKQLIQSGYCYGIPNRGWEPAIYDHYSNGNRGKITYGKWNTIQTEDIQQSILEVYKNYDTWQKKAKEGSTWISKKWKNENSLNRIKAVLNKL